MKRKSTVFIVVFFIAFGASYARAAETPERNQLCWIKSACEEQYKAAGWCDDKEKPCASVVNWIQDKTSKTECGDSAEWGFCVPPGRAQLSISFNGKNEVKDVGEYIKLIYAFLVGIAGIIAAVVIVKGGFEYLTAAGSSERMTAAKSTIGSAVFGLLLVLASYVLLNTLNPDLVHLRLPNVYMVRKLALGTDWCKDATINKKFAAANVSYADVVKLPGNWNMDGQKTECGKEYWIPDGEGKMCKGQSCEGKCGGKQPCACTPLNSTTAPEKQKFECASFNIAGTISFAEKKNADDLWLKVLCTDDSVKDIASSKITTSWLFGDNAPKTRYALGIHDKNTGVGGPSGLSLTEIGSKQCGGDDKIKGYFFVVEANDTSGVISSNDDQWIGGKSLCANPSCPWYGRNQLNNGHAANFIKTAMPNYAEGILFSQIEMLKGITCNLNISPQSFPNLDSGIKTFPCGINQTIPPPP